MEIVLHGNALLALAAAALWGGGDFSGGMGVKPRRRHDGCGTAGDSVEPCGESGSSGGGVVVEGGSVSAWAPLVWGTGCRGDGGDCAGLLLCGFVARGDGGFGGVERLLAAAIPAAVSASAEGSPGLLRLVGFLVAGLAIWLIAAGRTRRLRRAGSRDRLAGGGGGRGIWRLFCGCCSLRGARG